MNKLVLLVLIMSLSQTCCEFFCKSVTQTPCFQRIGAKYKHNQCYWPYAPKNFHHFRYTCLNRNNIAETIIASTKIFGSSYRVNHFKYFTKQNDTHIMCGDNSLEKSCAQKNLRKSVNCTKEHSDKIIRISQEDVCFDFHFTRAKNFTNTDYIRPWCK